MRQQERRGWGEKTSEETTFTCGSLCFSDSTPPFSSASGGGGLAGPSCQSDEREKTSVSDGIIAKRGNRTGFMNSMQKRSYSLLR